VSLGGSTGITLNDLSDVVIGTLENHEVLAYHTATNDWRQLKLDIADLNGVSITGQPANEFTLISNGIDFVSRQMTLNDISNVNTTAQASKDVLISTGTEYQNRQLVLNDISQVLVSAQSNKQTLISNGTNYVNRQLEYGDLSGSLAIQQLSNVNTTTSPQDAFDGSLLRYNTSTLNYDRRKTQYYNLVWFGQLNAITTSSQRALMLASNWTGLTQNTEYGFPQTPAKFSVGSLTNGGLFGFDATKTYKFDLHMSMNAFDLTATTDITVVLRATDANGSILSTSRVRLTADAQCPSLHNICIVNGYSSYFYGFTNSTGTLTGTVNNVQFAFSAVEI
jgi:hypothetical protein